MASHGIRRGHADGLPRASAVRCDFLMLMFESKLTRRVGSLSAPRQRESNKALTSALQRDQ